MGFCFCEAGNRDDLGFLGDVIVCKFCEGQAGVRESWRP